MFRRANVVLAVLALLSLLTASAALAGPDHLLGSQVGGRSVTAGTGCSGDDRTLEEQLADLTDTQTHTIDRYFLDVYDSGGSFGELGRDAPVLIAEHPDLDYDAYRARLAAAGPFPSAWVADAFKWALQAEFVEPVVDADYVRPLQAAWDAGQNVDCSSPAPGQPTTTSTLQAVTTTTTTTTTAPVAPVTTTVHVRSAFQRYVLAAPLTRRHTDALRLYWAFFDREPDVDGARYWVATIDRCAGLLDVTYAFGNSTEFIVKYGEVSDLEFIRLVYGNVLDREPDTEGAFYWLDLLRDGRLDRSGLMLYFSLSEEFRSSHPLSGDNTSDNLCTPPTTAPTPTSATRRPATVQPTQPAVTNQPARYYRNCSAARAAGAAPIRRGQPGYRSALDRDNDGIACE